MQLLVNVFVQEDNFFWYEKFWSQWLHAIEEREREIVNSSLSCVHVDGILLHVTVQRLLFACYSGDELRPHTDC